METSSDAVACETCGRKIIFRHHLSTGNPAPIDADPSPAGEGNIILLDDGERYRVKKKSEEVPVGTPLHVNHYVTCPDASGWRRLYEERRQKEAARS